ncbi:tetratricopeptide repeat protein [Cetobacterium sp.]|uniref:tetratricopeptide repeat protein n=1 Tax=Cetobacterium sp. TaxID=2071632 RepID=UPI003F2C0AAA
MKRILLYILLSITIFSEPILLKNENQLTDSSQKISVVEYEKLKWKFEQLEKEIRELKENSINNKGILSDVTQKYVDVSLYLKESTGDVKSLYKESFNDLKTLIYQFLALVIAVLIGIKVIGTWELNKKFEEIEKIKEALKKLEDDVKTKYEQLDKKTAEDLEKIRSEVEFKRENINELSGEIKNTLNAEKENIIKEIKKEISKDSKISDEIIILDYKESENKNEGTSETMDVKKCKNLVRNNNYDEAILGYENIIKNSKNKAELYEAYNGLGEIYKNQKRYEESLINYKKALMNIEGQTIDNRITLYNQLSHVCYMSNRYDEALRYNEIAYELNPNTSDEYLLSSLSDLYERQNNKEKAIKMLEQIKSKNSEKYLIYETNEKIANIYSTFKDYEKAIEIYEDLLDETKNLYTHNLPILYFRMGYNYYMANKYKEALVNLKKIDKNSDYYEIGQSYIEEIKKKS